MRNSDPDILYVFVTYPSLVISLLMKIGLSHDTIFGYFFLATVFVFAHY